MTIHSNRGRTSFDLVSRSYVPALLCSLTLLGCGGSDPLAPEIAPVKGTLTVNGSPAADVKIKFAPVEGGRASLATTDEAGNFELTYSPRARGAKIGDHQVTLEEPAPSVEVDTEITHEELRSKTPLSKEILESSKIVRVQEGSNNLELAFP